MNEYLIDLLKDTYNDNDYKKIVEGFNKEKYLTFRLNLLKANEKKVLSEFKDNDYVLENVKWCTYAYVVKKEGIKPIRQLDCYLNGEIYLQSLSSMLPVLVLKPLKNETILDMAAAPGSKTTQMAMEVANKALITAVEKNKIRQERLKYNLKKQGVTCVTILNMNAKNLDELFSFEKVLLDSPCSGSGTITKNTHDFTMYTKENLNYLKKLQTTLLIKALKVLKKGHTLVYSTCSILPQENEEVLEEAKKIIDFDYLPLDLNSDIPLLPTTINEVKCICPNQYFEGFFIAHIRKK